MTEAYIFDAVRTPRGKGKKDGSLHEVKAIDLLKNLFDALRDRNTLDTSQVEDVVLGFNDLNGWASSDNPCFNCIIGRTAGPTMLILLR